MTSLNILIDQELSGINVKVTPENEGDLVVKGANSHILFDDLRDYLKGEGVRLTVSSQGGTPPDMTGYIGIHKTEDIQQLREYLEQHLGGVENHKVPD